MKINQFAPLLFCLLLLVACKKDDPLKMPRLPDATQEGKNTMGFTFDDGKVWVPYFECKFMSNPCGKANVSVSPLADTYRQIGFSFGRFGKENRTHLKIGNGTSNPVSSTGEKIDSINVSFLSDNISPFIEYNKIQPGSSFIITRFDRENEIISGTFHFILRDYKTVNTITLSNGRFDYKFGTCECD